MLGLPKKGHFLPNLGVFSGNVGKTIGKRVRDATLLSIFQFFIEVSQVVQERAEGPKAPSPGHRPGYNSNQQGAL